MAVRFLIRNALILALIGLCAFFATQSDAFVTVGNFKNILINSSILSIIVVTSTMLLIAGHLDLSVGSTVGLGAIMAGYSLLEWGWTPAAAIALGIVVGSVVGTINGSLCGILGFSPIIVTLGMLAAVRATTLLITESAVFGLGEPFNTLGSGELAAIPILVLFAGGAFLLGWLFLGFTPWGRHTYAIGVNPQAAFLSGLPVRALPFWLYVATGASAGLAGVLFASRLDGAAPADMGAGLEIDALTRSPPWWRRVRGRKGKPRHGHRRGPVPRGTSKRPSADERHALRPAPDTGTRSRRRRRPRRDRHATRSKNRETQSNRAETHPHPVSPSSPLGGIDQGVTA